MLTDWTEDQYRFAEVVRRFMADKSPPGAVRELMESTEGYSPEVWQQLCSEVGLAGIHIPEKYGGFGFGIVEMGIAAEEMGSTLFCGPFFSSAVMAGYALLDSAEESHQERLLPGIAAGTTIATLVVDDLNDPGRVGQSITADAGTGNRLSGTAPIVLDAHIAHTLIVAASTGGNGLALYEVDPAAGVSIEPRASVDATRKLARVTFEEAPATELGVLDPATLSRLWDKMCAVLAHEMIGGAQTLLDSTVDYTKMRYQFGRPIGSFQGLKHRAADLLTELELAKAATRHATQSLASGEGETWAASMAKAMASDSYVNIAKAAIQLRGGVGFTWEDDTHLWFKRAKSSEVFLGAPHMHRERMMRAIEENGDV